MTSIVPVLLAGGHGNRLWPLSRKSYPKQFVKLVGETSLFQQSVLRLCSSDIIDFKPHIILTNSDFRFIVTEQMQDVGIDPNYIIIEPEPKNTAPPILASSLFAYKKDPETILLVTPSDHVIPDIKAFHHSVELGINHVNNGKIVTFGIKPSSPVTGYGYIEIMNENLDSSGTSTIKRFVEKPEIEVAQKMINEGNFLWNAGIFMFRAIDMIKAFEKYFPDILPLTKKAINTAIPDLGFLRINPEFWKDLNDISIDYAIMEKSKNLVSIPFSSEWSDLGNWEAVWDNLSKDDSGVALSGDAHAIDCKNSLIRSESESQNIIGLGLRDIIAVAMPDAVLVSHKRKSQDVKKVVEYLKSNKIRQAETFPKDHRPWGWFESLSVGKRFQVKRIYVKPGASLSLQSHKFRSEHWVSVEGKAKVTIGKKVQLITEGQSVYIPVGEVHRLENPGSSPIVLIEIQTGSYFGEDDIVRYQDIYSRR